MPFVIAFLLGQLGSVVLEPAPGALLLAVVAGGSALLVRARGRSLLGVITAALVGLELAARAALVPTGGCLVPHEGQRWKRWVRVDVSGVERLSGRDVRVVGRTVVEAPERSQVVCGLVAITVENAPPEVRPGSGLRLHVRLGLPRETRGPGVASNRARLARRGILVVGWGRGADVSVERLSRSFRGRISRFADRVREGIEGAATPRAAGVLRALVLGERSAIDPGLHRRILDAGLAHLLAVSGLHVGLAWGWAFLGLRWLATRSERLLLGTDVDALAAVVAIAPAVAYAALAGTGAATERALSTTVLVAAAAVAVRRARPWRLLAAAAVVVACIRPGAPLEPGFQLSFTAVAGTLAGVRALAASRWRPRSTGGRCLRVLVTLLIVSTAATLATAPLVAHHFHRWTPIGLVANPIVVPVVATAAIAGGLLALAATAVSTTAGHAAFVIASWPAHGLVAAAELFGSLPGGSWPVAGPDTLEIAAIEAALLVGFLASDRRWRIGALVALLVVGGWMLRPRSVPEGLRVTFLDVGQGDAALVELPSGAVVVIDGGGRHQGRFDVGERVVAPALWQRRIPTIDLVVASHGDEDHQGGLRFLAEAFVVRELWVPGAETASRFAALAESVRRRGGRVRRVWRGERARFGGIALTVLHPPRDARPRTSNDASIVVRIDDGSNPMLFAGDVEAQAERELLDGPREDLRAVVLKVPHHGSRTSSTGAWVRSVAPRFAVVSVGAANPFGLPDRAVLARHRRIGSQVLRTDLHGAIVVESVPEGLEVRAPWIDAW